MTQRTPLATVAVAGAVALLAVGCGGGGSDDDAATTAAGVSAAPSTSAVDPIAGTPTTGSEAPETSASTTSPPTSSASSAPPATATTATTDGAIVVDSFAGPVELPADPQRVVVLDASLVAGTLIDLDVPVVGLTSIRPDTLTDDESAALPDVGTIQTPNFEAIADLEPDLIIASPQDEATFELFEQIAPTYPYVLSGDWRTDVRAVATAVNQSDRIEQQLAEFDARVDEVAEQVAAVAPDTNAVLVRARQDLVRAHTNQHFSGNLLGEVGLATPDAFQRDDTDDPEDLFRSRAQDLSPEEITLLDSSDTIFVTARGTLGADQAAEAAREDLFNNPLWQTLPAQQNGRVIVVEPHWTYGGIREARLVLDDIEAAYSEPIASS